MSELNIANVYIPRATYDKLIKDSTKLEIVKALVMTNSDNYMNVKEIKAVLGIKEKEEDKGEENGGDN